MNGLGILIATLLILYLPITWVIVFYWSNKSKQYWMPAISCVLAHVAFLPLLIVSSVVDINDDFDIAVVILLLLLLVVIGITISALIVLYITKRRIWVLSFLLAFSALALSPLLDYVEFDPVLYFVSKFLGTETDFQGHKIHFGNTYIYTGGYDYLSISKIKPGYVGIEDFHMLVLTGTKEKIEELNKSCLDEKNSCTQEEHEAYQTIFYTVYNPRIDFIWTDVFYYNMKCDVYLRHSKDERTEKDTDFIARFFNDNCS